MLLVRRAHCRFMQIYLVQVSEEQIEKALTKCMDLTSGCIRKHLGMNN
jgi:hypothetical protein